MAMAATITEALPSAVLRFIATARRRGPYAFFRKGNGGESCDFRDGMHRATPVVHSLEHRNGFRRKTAPLLASLCLAFFAVSAHAAQPPVAHIFVALADNTHQGIVPVPAFLGNGDDAAQNLYWGAAYGVKTFFGKKGSAWKRESCRKNVSEQILERCVFSSTGAPRAYLVADAYRGRDIGLAMQDFMRSVAGKLALREEIPLPGGGATRIDAPQGARLSIYVGHNGLMDAPLRPLAATFPAGARGDRQAAVLACKSQAYFAAHLERSGAQNLVTTYDFMAPEAYVVEGIVESWRQGGSAEQARIRAAQAYARYQKIPERTARRMFGAPRP